MVAGLHGKIQENESITYIVGLYVLNNQSSKSIPTALPVCVLCGSNENREIQVGVRFNSHLVVRSCNSCELVFVWPRPTPEEEIEYYKTSYRNEYQGSVTPEKTYNKSSVEAGERVKRMTPLLSSEMQILDVGASSGAFLNTVKSQVHSVMGVEPDQAHRSWAQTQLKLDMVRDISELDKKRFHLITLFHTLEHIPDPVTFLRTLAGYLIPGGKIIIEVPNADDALLTLYKLPSFARFYYQRAHIYYFSEKTLLNSIKIAGGLAKVTGIQRYDLSNHLRWLITEEPGGQNYYQDIFHAKATDAYAEDLIKAGYADTLWAVAQF